MLGDTKSETLSPSGYKLTKLNFHVYARVLFWVILTTLDSVLALETPVALSPGTTNSPGPVLENSRVSLSWKAVGAATGYHVSIRDLVLNQLTSREATAQVTNAIVTLSTGHSYRWNICALQDTNETEFSRSLYFQISSFAIRPSIFAIAPDPVPGVDTAQPIIVYGDNFSSNCSVVLRDENTGEVFPNRKLDARRVNFLSFTANLTHAEARWSVEVINVGELSSGRFFFKTVSPANISSWRWWRSGWPWCLGVGTLLLGATIAWAMWLIRYKSELIANSRITGAATERERLCRDLHDGIKGELSLVTQYTEKTSVLLESGKSASELTAAVQGIRAAARNAHDAIEDVLWVQSRKTRTFTHWCPDFGGGSMTDLS